MIAPAHKPRARTPFRRPRPTVKPTKGTLLRMVQEGRLPLAVLEASVAGKCRLVLVVRADGTRAIAAEFEV